LANGPIRIDAASRKPNINAASSLIAFDRSHARCIGKVDRGLRNDAGHQRANAVLIERYRNEGYETRSDCTTTCRLRTGMQQTVVARTFPDGFLRSSLVPGEERRNAELL
jgi:hypothetical protein